MAAFLTVRGIVCALGISPGAHVCGILFDAAGASNKLAQRVRQTDAGIGGGRE